MSKSDHIEGTEGAAMFPSFCPPEAPTGEYEIFKLLATDTGASGWIVLHSLDIAEHVRAVQGEADFIVLIPNEGILILEVKSHKSVKLDERGWWLGNGTKPDKRGPFRQASEALHSIRGYLQARNMTNGLLFVSAVVFTSLPFQFNSPEWHNWQVLDKKRLHAQPISVNLLNIIRNAREFYASKNLVWMKNGISASPERLDKVAQALRPRFEILSSPLERKKQLEDGLKRSTEEQLRIIDDSAENPRLLVSGLAGTGKTTLAIEVVRREKMIRTETVVGFFCFNHLLGRFLASECKPLGSGIRLGSFHSWMMEFSDTTPSSNQAADPKFWNRELPDLCIARLTAPGAQNGFLDLLVLDEAQDLFIEPYLDIFDLLLKGGLKGGQWRFFGDFERQDIFAKGVVPKDDFFNKRIDQRCALKILSENCRNTQEISSALTIHARLKPGYSKVLRQDTRHDPEIRRYKNEAEQMESVQGLLDQYQAEGFKPSEIVLLSPRKSGCLAQALASAPPWKGRIKEYAGKPSSLTFSTIYAFKGLEAAVVILTDIDSLVSQRDFDIIYVGMSRALHRLAVHFNERVAREIEKSCAL
jgi:Nuclease-related domain/UvrD-like helicase C-terminal domain